MYTVHLLIVYFTLIYTAALHSDSDADSLYVTLALTAYEFDI